MAVTRTFTVTVVSTGSGNKYFIDGVQQDTVSLAEGYTYKFDQADSSNGTHPLRFSTTSDGTHNSGSEYTTGVTTAGTPGSSGAYTQITVATSAPTLYYYCTNHSGMGGQANTVEANTWGVLPWNRNAWGSQDGITVSLTSPGAVAALGTPQSFNVEGWGRQAWNNSGWGVEYSVEPSGQSISSVVGSVEATQIITVELSGFSTNVDFQAPTIAAVETITISGLQITSSLGDVSASNFAGWGRQAWGNSGWGVEYTVEVGGLAITSAIGTVDARETETVLPTGLAVTTSVGEISPADVIGISSPGVITSAIGSLDNSGTLVGWGRNGWSEEPYGDSNNIIVLPTGVSASASVGSLTAADVMGLTGVEATASVGSITPADVMGLTGVEATAVISSVSAADSITLQSQTITSSVGSVTVADQAVGLTGQSITSTTGSVEITSAPIVAISGVSTTISVGSLTPADVIGLTGVSSTASVGSLTPADIMGLTGLSVTSSLGKITTIPIYGDIDTGSNSSYSDVSTGSNSSYSNVATGSNTSYSDAA